MGLHEVGGYDPFGAGMWLPGDAVAIHNPLSSSFPAEEGTKFVEACAPTGQRLVPFVTEANEQIPGHVAFSPVAHVAEAETLPFLTIGNGYR